LGQQTTLKMRTVAGGLLLLLSAAEVGGAHWILQRTCVRVCERACSLWRRRLQNFLAWPLSALTLALATALRISPTLYPEHTDAPGFNRPFTHPHCRVRLSYGVPR
jgi:hypothetical protein